MKAFHKDEVLIKFYTSVEKNKHLCSMQCATYILVYGFHLKHMLSISVLQRQVDFLQHFFIAGNDEPHSNELCTLDDNEWNNKMDAITIWWRWCIFRFRFTTLQIKLNFSCRNKKEKRNQKLKEHSRRGCFNSNIGLKRSFVWERYLHKH